MRRLAYPACVREALRMHLSPKVCSCRKDATCLLAVAGTARRSCMQQLQRGIAGFQHSSFVHAVGPCCSAWSLAFLHWLCLCARLEMQVDVSHNLGRGHSSGHSPLFSKELLCQLAPTFQELNGTLLRFAPILAPNNITCPYHR